MMKQKQKQKFTPAGISVKFVGEAQENEAATQAVLNDEIQLVYIIISPESLFSKTELANVPKYKIPGKDGRICC